MIWEPFMLALVLGIIVSAGLYFAYLWPSVEPREPADDDPAAAPEPAAPPAPDPASPAADSAAPAVATSPTADSAAPAVATSPAAEAPDAASPAP